jgi:hypothetical protein
MLLIIFQQADGSFKISTVATKLFGDDFVIGEYTDKMRMKKIFKRGNTVGIFFSTGGNLETHLYFYFKFINQDWHLIGTTREI